MRRALKSAASLVPIFGSGVNAAITFGVHEATGWGLYLIFDAGGDPTKMSKEELKAYIKKGKEMAKVEKKKYDEVMSKLPPDTRAEVEALQKKLGDKNLSDTEMQSIMSKIDELVAINN